MYNAAERKKILYEHRVSSKACGIKNIFIRVSSRLRFKRQHNFPDLSGPRTTTVTHPIDQLAFECDHRMLYSIQLLTQFLPTTTHQFNHHHHHRIKLVLSIKKKSLIKTHSKQTKGCAKRAAHIMIMIIIRSLIARGELENEFLFGQMQFYATFILIRPRTRTDSVLYLIFFLYSFSCLLILSNRIRTTGIKGLWVI